MFLQTTSERNPIQLFIFYVNQRFPIVKYVSYTSIWMSALFSVFATAGGQTLAWDAYPHYIGMGFSVFCLLLFMRTIDEVKDLDYDRRFKPDRPLVRGILTTRDMRIYAWIIGLFTLILNTLLDWRLAAAALAIMGYSVFLLLLERLSKGFADSMYLNILVSIQLKTGLIGYVYLGYCLHNTSLTFVAVAIITLSFLLSYLHWEIGRKIEWPALSAAGEKLYSRAAGVPGSLSICGGFLLAAIGIMLWYLQPWHGSGMNALAGWLLLLPLLPTASALVVFLRRKSAKNPLGQGTLIAYIIFLLVNIV